jgi:hypothetical protein
MQINSAIERRENHSLRANSSPQLMPMPMNDLLPDSPSFFINLLFPLFAYFGVDIFPPIHFPSPFQIIFSHFPGHISPIPFGHFKFFSFKFQTFLSPQKIHFPTSKNLGPDRKKAIFTRGGVLFQQNFSVHRYSIGWLTKLNKMNEWNGQTNTRRWLWPWPPNLPKKKCHPTPFPCPQWHKIVLHPHNSHKFWPNFASIFGAVKWSQSSAFVNVNERSLTKIFGPYPIPREISLPFFPIHPPQFAPSQLWAKLFGHHLCPFESFSPNGR